MTTQREIDNAAKHLVKTHGADAARFANGSADRLADERDRAGAGYWRSIANIVGMIEADLTAARRRQSNGSVDESARLHCGRH